VIDAQTKQPLASKISYDLLPENSSVGFTVSDSVTGEYEILLPAGSAYEYKAESEGYKSVTATIDLLDETDFVVINRIIELNTGTDEPFLATVDSVDRKSVAGFVSGETRELILSSAVLFDFASDYMNESSFAILDQVAKFMKNNPSLSLVLEGHTDSVGPAQYNLSLSKRRAQSVEAYFVEKGIKKSRFETKGYGMQQPIATNDTKEGRSQNRRVVFSIKE
jgi:outer membrane protein OmpA-like peptidoglycan-associated protein